MNCILHNNIEGPSSDRLFAFQNTDVTLDNFENIYQTPPLRTAGGYYHYEKLGVGNTVEFEFSNLTFEHNMMYFLNVRATNNLGVENVIASSGFLVDLEPPTPGMIRNAASNVVQSDGCNVGVVIPGCLDNSGIDNHR